MKLDYQAELLARRRRPFDRLEAKAVRLHLRRPDPDADRLLDRLRYVISFARLTAVRNQDGQDVEVSGPLHLHALYVQEQLEPALASASSLWEVVKLLPELVGRTRATRTSLLRHLPLDRDSLEAEVTTRKLAIASGGGGGGGYVYPGCYHRLERAGLAPDLMVGTSIGSLMGMFRARRKRYDQAPLVAAGRSLSWSKVFRVLETENRYGLPATLRLYLRTALGPLFTQPDGRAMWLSDMEIPLYVIATGITVDALKHDLNYYEHLLDRDMNRSVRAGVRNLVKTTAILREFMSRTGALVEVVLGRAPGTEDFDVLDAAGFSSAIPGVIHYDVLRPDQRMKRMLDSLYAEYGITRLGEGGMVANVPARICWETVVNGQLDGRRNVFVLALDCFSPNPRSLAWFPLQALVRTWNVAEHMQYADLYLPLTRILSPMNLVPSIQEALTAMRWGREAIDRHIPFISTMVRPIGVLR